MAKTPATFDVWIVETNTVYKQVPYTVVTDWAQQGRLLPEDQVRFAGAKDWSPLSELAAFKPYMPHTEPMRADDQAEAMEPVEVGFSWRHRGGEEDDDVDMIPLIDISLVLLIFFMMTATVGAVGGVFNTPEAKHRLITINPAMYWVGIRPGKAAADGQQRYTYSVGRGETEKPQDFADQATPDAVVHALREMLANEPSPVQLRVRADRELPCELVIQTMTAELDKFRGDGAGKITKVFTEVSEKERP